MVAFTYARWLLTRGSSCKALTGKSLVFWIGGRLWVIIIAHQRCLHLELWLYYNSVFHFRYTSQEPFTSSTKTHFPKGSGQVYSSSSKHRIKPSLFSEEEVRMKFDLELLLHLLFVSSAWYIISWISCFFFVFKIISNSKVTTCHVKCFAHYTLTRQSQVSVIPY